MNVQVVCPICDETVAVDGTQFRDDSHFLCPSCGASIPWAPEAVAATRDRLPTARPSSVKSSVRMAPKLNHLGSDAVGGNRRRATGTNKLPARTLPKPE